MQLPHDAVPPLPFIKAFPHFMGAGMRCLKCSLEKRATQFVSPRPMGLDVGVTVLRDMIEPLVWGCQIKQPPDTQSSGLNETTISLPSGSTAYNFVPAGSNRRQVGVALELFSEQSDPGRTSISSWRLSIPPSSWASRVRTRIFPPLVRTANLFATLEAVLATIWR